MREPLPEKFISRMREQLGEEADAFFACFEEESQTGIRVNTGKIRPETLAGSLFARPDRVRWTENGFYSNTENGKVSRHPFYYAGLYYIQEPSAMLPASRLPVEPGDRLLDLCAAPGGKATELASRLQGSGLLVANDVSASRAKALLKNLTLWGAPNICVTAETPERLLSAFGCFFDKILVDAPCSGEGMFRRDRKLVTAWAERGPEEYAPIQKKILACAAQMLRPGGMLLYSTCTFSPQEDEEVVAETLLRFPELCLVQPGTEDGFSSGIAPYEKCVRLYPHRVRGEGHFLALMRKKRLRDTPDHSGTEKCGWTESGEESALKRAAAIIPGTEKNGRGKQAEVSAEGDEAYGLRSRTHEKNDADSRTPPAVAAFLSLCRRGLPVGYRYFETDGQCFLLPPYPLPRGLRYLRTGLLLGTGKNGRFEPSQALAMCLDAGTFETVFDLSCEDARALRYLKGETLELTEEEQKNLETLLLRAKRQMEENAAVSGSLDSHSRSGQSGGPREGRKKHRGPAAGEVLLPVGWVLVCVGGHALGWAKYAGGALRNKYYPGWRLQ